MKAVNLLVDEGLTTEVAWTIKSSSELRTLTQTAYDREQALIG